MTRIVKGTFASECSTMFWPTRLTYSVIIGSSTNLASLSTWAASIRPIFTSFSVPEANLPHRPLLMFRLPIISGSSFGDKGCFFAEAVVVCGLDEACGLDEGFALSVEDG